MKKEMILTLLCFASLQTMAATQEVELKPTKIHGGGATFSGSVLSGERKNTVIITDKDIEKKQYKNITEIFEDSPFTMVTHTPAGPVVALRGSGEKTLMRVKVLVDGNSMNSMDENMGIIPFDSIPAASIKKIEIIPGGGITLYGSGSSSGVINIVTKNGEEKEYGQVGVSAASYDTYKVDLTKGVQFGKKVFSNFSIEGQKGKGYREKEEHEKVNVLAGINVNLNDRNRVRVSGMVYHEDAKGTDELDLITLQKHRRGAGPSEAEIKSDRHSLALDYEYKPKENWTITAGVYESKFKRKIDQDNRPYVQYLPSAGFNDFFGQPKNYSSDLVLKDVRNRMHGSMEEREKGIKLKSEYEHKRGKFIFGMEHADHRVKREMHMQTSPYNEMDNLRLFLRPRNERVVNADIIVDPEKMMNPNTYLTILLLYSDPEGIGFDKKKLIKRLNDVMYEKAKAEGIQLTEKEIKKYQAGEDFPWDWEKTTKNVMWKTLYEISKDKLIDYTKGNNLYLIAGRPPKKVEITTEDTFENVYKIIGVEYLDKTLQAIGVMDATVDVKKDIDSFYLFNTFDITDKLELNAGLRYEKARYIGNRKSIMKQHIKGDSSKEEGAFLVKFLASTSDYEYLNYLHHSGKIDFYGSELGKEKEKEFKETGETTIIMSELTKREKRTEENLGGEIGLNYKWNPYNTVYGKYERAFNSPLPNQLTNKTFDPRLKVKTYWESNLKTETIDNFEIGLRGAINDNITYSLAGFISDTHNEILTIVKDGSSHMNREWRFVNIGKTRRMGLELQAQENFDKLTLKQSFTYVNPKIISNDYEAQIREIAKDKAEAQFQIFARNRRNFSIPIVVRGYGQPKEVEEKFCNDVNAVLEDLYVGKINSQSATEKVGKIIDDSPYGKDEKKKKKLFNTLKSFSSKHNENIKETFKKELQAEIDKLSKDNFLNKGDRVPLAPKVKATFSADYQFTDRLKMGSNVTYIGSYLNAEPSFGYEVVRVKVPSHAVMDFYGTYNLHEDFSVKFGINNVFNHQYYLRQDSRTATPAPGRTYSVGFSYRF
ncbi:MAG: TonB-dependent receptor [Fusobacterium necrophorum]|nr:TonB-dependent receptor [Fusobacterium necrophorum]